jgi:L-lactate dehydrogenase complex protein LldG
MAMAARDVIMDRIRAAQGPAPAAIEVPRTYRAAGGVEESPTDGADLVDLLVDRLIDYRATVRQCSGADLATAVAELCGRSSRLAVAPGVPAAWLSSYTGEIVRDGDPQPLTVVDLDVPGVTALTGCAVAIAETGTLVLDAGPESGRRLLTLVPDHHVCVVHTGQIAASVPQALARLADRTRPLTFVSGPSATSDIELNRVEGVHGPRNLDVIVLSP